MRCASLMPGSRQSTSAKPACATRAIFSKNMACETSISIGWRSSRSGSSARRSTRSSAPACSTICPTRISAFGHCAMSLMPNGAMHLMVYAAYGRAGIYMMQEYCRLLGVGATEEELRDLGTTIGALISRPSDRRRGEAGEGFQTPGRARRCTAPPPGPRLHRAAALCLARALRPIVRALVRAGSLSAAMRGNRAACRTPRVSPRLRRHCSTPRSNCCAGP